MQKKFAIAMNEDLLRQVKALEIKNLSGLMEEMLAKTIQVETRKQWLVDNKPAIDEYNFDNLFTKEELKGTLLK